MACVSMDLSDPTAQNLCFSCGAPWTREIEDRCPDCGAALVARERVIREFEGSVRNPDASLPELSSLDLLCTTSGEDEQRHVRNRLEEYDMPYFCFSEEQKREPEGSPAPVTNFYIAALQIEWASERLADFFRGGSSVLLARALNDVEALTYRATLEDRDIGYTTSRLTGMYPMAAGIETLFFVAEVDVEAARRAIEDVRNGEASTISAGEGAGEAVPGARPADDPGPDPQGS